MCDLWEGRQPRSLPHANPRRVQMLERMSETMRHARENPELYEDPEYSIADELRMLADQLRGERKAGKATDAKETPRECVAKTKGVS